MADEKTKPDEATHEGEQTEIKRTEPVALMSGTTNASGFAGYPKTMYNPVLGGRTANDPNEAASLFQPEGQWFNTAAEADMHRTEREAQMVIHQNTRDKLEGMAQAQDGAAPVRNSVQAQESINAGNPEPV